MGSRAHRRQGGIIDAHHGEVRVESADHTATTFILHLPWRVAGSGTSSSPCASEDMTIGYSTSKGPVAEVLLWVILWERTKRPKLGWQASGDITGK
jgi:hypothetical protein